MKTLTANFWNTILSVLDFVPFTFFYGDFGHGMGSYLLAALADIILGIALAAFYKGLSVGKLGIVAPVTAIYPLFAIILGMLVLVENPTPVQAVASILMIGGSVIVGIEMKTS